MMMNSALFWSPSVSSSSSSYAVSSRSSAISKGASRAAQEIRILFAVLPETKSQGLFHQIHKKQGRKSTPDSRPSLLSTGSSHLPHFVFQHTLDFIAHGFRAGGAEMDANLVSGLSNLPHQCRGVLLQLNGRCAGRIFNAHILQGSFLQGIRSALPPFSLPPRFPLGSSFRQRE